MAFVLILLFALSCILSSTLAVEYSGEFIPKSYYVIDREGHRSDVVYFRNKREVDLTPLLRLKRGNPAGGGGAQSGASASAMASASASSFSGGGAGNTGGSNYGGGTPSGYGGGGAGSPTVQQQSVAGSGGVAADAASLNFMQLQSFLKSLFDAASQHSNLISNPSGYGGGGGNGAGAYSQSFSGSGAGGGGLPAGFPGIPDFSGFATGFGNGIPDYAQYHGPILFSRFGEDTGKGVKVSGSAQGPNGAFSSSSTSVDSTGKVKYSVQSGKY